MIRRTFLAGLFTLLPLVVTLWVLRAIFNSLVGVFDGPLTWLALKAGMPQPGHWVLAFFSAIATLLLLVLVGALVGNFVGRQLLAWMDELMLHVPVVKGIYGATKQLIGAIQSGQGGSFKDVVLVEWPQEGSWTLAFVAHRNCAWAREGGEAMVAVYIPTAPNPTSGYVVMLEVAKVRPLPVSPDQVDNQASGMTTRAKPTGPQLKRSGRRLHRSP